MKKILSFTAALVISFGCLTACGSSSDSSEESTVESTEATIESTQATTSIAATTVTEPLTTTATEPTYDFDLKYTSLTKDTLGDPEEFINILRCKLKLIFDIDELDVSITNEKNFDGREYTRYVCSFKCGCDDDLTMEISSNIFESNLDYLQLEMNGPAMFPYSDTEKYNEHLCEFLIPIAVFKDYSSKEELLAEWDSFVFTSNYDPEEEAQYGGVKKKYLADYYCNISYNLKYGIAFFYPKTSSWAN